MHIAAEAEHLECKARLYDDVVMEPAVCNNLVSGHSDYLTLEYYDVEERVWILLEENDPEEEGLHF